MKIGNLDMHCNEMEHYADYVAVVLERRAEKWAAKINKNKAEENEND